jgi:hypothetical protein
MFVIYYGIDSLGWGWGGGNTAYIKTNVLNKTNKTVTIK